MAARAAAAAVPPASLMASEPEPLPPAADLGWLHFGTDVHATLRLTAESMRGEGDDIVLAAPTFVLGEVTSAAVIGGEMDVGTARGSAALTTLVAEGRVPTKSLEAHQVVRLMDTMLQLEVRGTSPLRAPRAWPRGTSIVHVPVLCFIHRAGRLARRHDVCAVAGIRAAQPRAGPAVDAPAGRLHDRRHRGFRGGRRRTSPAASLWKCSSLLLLLDSRRVSGKGCRPLRDGSAASQRSASSPASHVVQPWGRTLPESPPPHALG